MRFRALTDIFTPGCGYAQAGQILSSTPGPGEIPIPSNWIPPANAVDPLDPDAVERYWQAANPTKPWLGFTLGGRFGGNLGVHPVV